MLSKLGRGEDGRLTMRVALVIVHWRTEGWTTYDVGSVLLPDEHRKDGDDKEEDGREGLCCDGPDCAVMGVVCLAAIMFPAS